MYVSNSATSIALDANRIYYSTFATCGAAGGEFPGVCRVRYTSKSSEHSFPRTDWSSGTSGPSPEDLASNIASGSDYLYWVDLRERLQRLPRAAIGFGTTVVATLENPSASSEVTADDQYVYWVENTPGAGGELFRSRGPGIAKELLVTNPDRHIRDIQADGFGGVLYITTHPFFFLCCLDVLERVTVDAGGAITVDRGDA